MDIALNIASRSAQTRAGVGDLSTRCRVACRNSAPNATWMAALCLLVAACGGPSVQTDPTEIDTELTPEKVAAQVAEHRARAVEQPHEPYWLYKAAETHSRAGQSVDAIAALRESLAVNDSYEPSLSLLSKIYYVSGQHQAAIQLLEDVQSRNGTLSDELLAGLALNYEALGEYDTSDPLFDTLRHRGSRESAVIYHLLQGESFLEVGDRAFAAVEAKPNVAANQNNFGIALLYQGRPKEARERFLRALELDADLPGAMYNMAIVDKFYFFDDESSLEWFTRYQQISGDFDPDGLAELLQLAPAEAVGR